jgi:AAA domain
MKIQNLMSSTAPIFTLYGKPGFGKTTLAAKFPNPLFFAHERGIPSGLEVSAVQGIDSFEGTMSALREICAEGAGDYRTLVFDTCAKHNWKTIEQPSYGKGWVACADEWRRFIRAVTAIRDKHGVIIVLICHAGIERIDDPRAPSYTCYGPKLHKRARELIMDASDVVGFLAEDLRIITSDGGFQERTRATAAPGRFLFLEGRPAFFAKNRFAMPAQTAIPLDFNFSELSKHWVRCPHLRVPRLPVGYSC